MITTSEHHERSGLSPRTWRDSAARAGVTAANATREIVRDGVRRITVIGNHVPRRCGIATFTTHLVDAISDSGRGVDVSVTAMNDTTSRYRYPARVRHQVRAMDADDYRRAAARINRDAPQVVSLQHEFGIYGGAAGSHVLDLLEDLEMPVVATMHTVLREPDRDQRYVVDRLRQLCERIVVMSEHGAGFLEQVYGIERDRIDMIHHGIPDVSYKAKREHSELNGLCNRKLLLTFGLLGPGKGIEHAIRALPVIVRSHPDVIYMIAGATHPNLIRSEGERYRESLIQTARDLNVTPNVFFYNQYISQEELETLLLATDVYLTPYPRIEQICSGTLAYALGCGNAVVSTPFWHAQELLAGRRGVLVEPRKPLAIADAVCRLLDNPDELRSMQRRAHCFGRRMVWSHVAERYLDSFDLAAARAISRPAARATHASV